MHSLERKICICILYLGPQWSASCNCHSRRILTNLQFVALTNHPLTSSSPQPLKKRWGVRAHRRKGAGYKIRSLSLKKQWDTYQMDFRLQTLWWSYKMGGGFLPPAMDWDKYERHSREIWKIFSWLASWIVGWQVYTDWGRVSIMVTSSCTMFV